MFRSIKIVGGFAAVGFLIPAASITYYIIASHFSVYPNMTPLFYLCPSSIVSMGLEEATPSDAIVVWLVICAINAVLYALPAALIVFLLSLRKSNISIP